MTFEGTASSINSALNGLVFMPDTDFRGQAVLQIVTSDTGGMGGPQTTIKTIDIDVTGPNSRRSIPFPATREPPNTKLDILHG